MRRFCALFFYDFRDRFIRRTDSLLIFVADKLFHIEKKFCNAHYTPVYSSIYLGSKD